MNETNDVVVLVGGLDSLRNQVVATAGATKVAHWTTRSTEQRVRFNRDPLIAFKGQVVA